MATGWDAGAAGDPFDVVLVGDAGGAMAAAVTLAGGRVIDRLAWTGSLPAVSDSLLAIDLGGVGDAALGDTADLARADLVVCDLDQLDLVADALLLADMQFLCAPSMAERVAALAFAAYAAATLDAVRQDGAARRDRFRVEVGRIAAVLARLAADEGTDGLADRRPGYDAGPAGRDPVPIDAFTVRQAIRARRLRSAFFGDGLFEDPAWDMLLDLFAAELEGGRVSVSSLCIAAHVAPTTALRWIGRLAEAGLFERRPDPRDRRRAFIALSPRGSAAMRGYATALERAGLTLG